MDEIKSWRSVSAGTALAMSSCKTCDCSQREQMASTVRERPVRTRLVRTNISCRLVTLRTDASCRCHWMCAGHRRLSCDGGRTYTGMCGRVHSRQRCIHIFRTLRRRQISHRNRTHGHKCHGLTYFVFSVGDDKINHFFSSHSPYCCCYCFGRIIPLTWRRRRRRPFSSVDIVRLSAVVDTFL